MVNKENMETPRRKDERTYLWTACKSNQFPQKPDGHLMCTIQYVKYMWSLWYNIICMMQMDKLKCEFLEKQNVPAIFHHYMPCIFYFLDAKLIWQELKCSCIFMFCATVCSHITWVTLLLTAPVFSYSLPPCKYKKITSFIFFLLTM